MADGNKKKYIEYESTRYELVDGEARTRITALETDKADTADVNAALAQKQNALTAGQNVTINGSTISAEVDTATIASNVTSWLNTNVNPVGSAVVVDASLSVSGAAADAKVVGDKLTNIKSDFLFVENQFSQNGVFDYLDYSDVPIGTVYTSHGVDFTRMSDGSIVVNGTASDTATFSLVRHKITKGKILFVDVKESLVPIQIFVNDKNNNTIKQMIFNRNAQFAIPNSDNVDNIYIRLRVEAGTILDNVIVKYAVYNVPLDDINILVFGNSFSYSTLSYVPSLLRELAPECNLTFGILYASGMQFTGQINNFNNNIVYEQYCEYTSFNQAWTKYNNTMTAKSALDRKKWDCIVLQQSAEHMDDFDNLEVFADLLSGYIKYPTEYLYNIPQARHANDTNWLPNHYDDDTGEARSNHHFEDIANYAKRALDGAIISAVLPAGTAVQNARTITAFKTIGNDGYLSKDALGHLQNGIGILIAGYAATYCLLEVINKRKKLYGTKLSPTDTWISNTNPPSAVHGSCVGISAENRLLGMKCAMMAVKNPFELTDCSNV